MLKRLYADNFRCLENFEIRLGESQVLLGRNGTGKTSMLDVLRNLQDLIVNGLKVDEVFPARDMSLHQSRHEQRFEIETESADDRYAYRLLVEHDIERRRTRVMHEVLDHNERRLFEFANGDAQLYGDNYSAGPSVPFDWSRSGVGFLTERHDNQKVTRFKKDIANYVFASACPPIMDTESRSEDRTLAPLMQNFAGWYKRAAQENMRYIPELFEALRDVIPGFEAISLAEFGETSWTLKVDISTPSGTITKHGFDQLSDGQRALIALYSLLHLWSDRRVSLFLDEPDNYIALSEIQPWLTDAIGRCGDSIEQLVVASHHPVTIDYMAGASGLWFSRDENGPVRVSDEPANAVDGISISETVARGWE